MADITEDFGKGGANVGDGSPTLALTLRDVADDLAELRTQFIALLAKLDADAVNTALDDLDYESELTPAAMATVKA